MCEADHAASPSPEERIARLEQELEVLKAELTVRNQLIEALKQKLYGSSSERLVPGQTEMPFGEGVLGKPAAPPEAGDETSAPEEQGKEKRSGKPRSKKKDRFPKNLKVVVDEISVPDEVTADPDSWVEIGERHHDELEVICPQMYWRRRIRKVFKHKSNRALPPISVAAPEPSLPGTLCGPSLAAQIVVDKYSDHLPHERQSKRFGRLFGVCIRRQTLNAWTHAVARHLEPIVKAIKKEVLGAHCLEIDETPCNYLDPGYGKTRQGYQWTLLDPATDTVYYEWKLGRSHECLLDILEYDEKTGKLEFEGTIACDGFAAYDVLASRCAGITLSACLAHIRRKFYEAMGQDTEVVLPILLKIRDLYRIERQLRCSKAPPICRKLVRSARSRPIVADLHRNILEERASHFPQSNLGKALNYALSQWEKFCLYLENGDLEIDNNLVENAIRPLKLGQKNYLFFGSAEAGKRSAILYTLIANCKAKGLDPEEYLAEVIKKLPANATPKQAAELTPAKVAAGKKDPTAEVAA
jgi:transposase